MYVAMTVPKHCVYNVFSYTITVPPAFNTTASTITVNETHDAILSCSADGIPRPTIVWYRGSLLSAGEQKSVYHEPFREDITGQNGITSTLNISNTDPDDDAGMYTCQANNDAGTVILDPEFMLVVIESGFNSQCSCY